MLRYVVLEYCRGFWVVSVEAVEYSIDVLRPFGRVIEGDTHVQWEGFGDIDWNDWRSSAKKIEGAVDSLIDKTGDDVLDATDRNADAL